MTPVISMSTREWQKQKLGPSVKREAGWVKVDILVMNRVAENFKPFFKAMKDLANVVSRDIIPVYSKLAKQLEPIAPKKPTYPHEKLHIN